MLEKITRRSFLAAAALPLGCALRRGDSSPPAPPPVRGPAIGQTWTYAKRDLITGHRVDVQVDQVAAVGERVEIDSRTQGDREGGEGQPGTGSWLHKYFSHPKIGARLPSEIQAPWGLVLVDPHWSQVQVFDEPIPLWPTRLTPGWRERFSARYKISDQSGSGLAWHQSMEAEAWDRIKVPAGEFRALRYGNVINFESSDPARTQAVRRETVWFAPEVGRWVVRESKGTYYLADSVSDSEYEESSYRWELQSFT